MRSSLLFFPILTAFTCFNLPLLSFSQISSEKMKILKEIDKHLSNGWTSNHNSQIFAEDYPNSYYVALYNKKTEGNGSNTGVSISVVNRKHKEEYIKIKSHREGDIFEFIETKNYIVRINYCNKNCVFKDCNDCQKKYLELLPQLLTDLKGYFNLNYSKL
jgi:hypothetical protein